MLSAFHTVQHAPVRRGRLVYQARMAGRSDGSLSFVVEAEPETDVLTNRTGFVVLHPIEGVAGKPVKVLHEDGREELSVFPGPHRPEMSVHRHPRAVARDRAWNLGHMHHGRRRL